MSYYNVLVDGDEINKKPLTRDEAERMVLEKEGYFLSRTLKIEKIQQEDKDDDFDEEC